MEYIIPLNFYNDEAVRVIMAIPPETPQTSRQYGTEKPLKHHFHMVPRGLPGAIQWAPIMLRAYSLMDSRCNFFISGR